jgi:hypothetical protein
LAKFKNIDKKSEDKKDSFDDNSVDLNNSFNNVYNLD